MALNMVSERIASEVNPKLEIRDPKQIQNSNGKMLQTGGRAGVLNLDFRSLGIVSDFEIYCAFGF
jgi:hypothetical protein